MFSVLLVGGISLIALTPLVSGEALMMGCGAPPYESAMQEEALQKYYKTCGGATGKWPKWATVKWDHKGGICAFDGNPWIHAYNPPGTRCLYGGFHPPPPKGDGGVMYLQGQFGTVEGQMPAEFKSLWMITTFTFPDEKITGTLWDTSKHCFLFQIYMNNNQLSGTIPNDAFSGSVHLNYVHFADNKLTGPLPSSFGKIDQMVSYLLNDNEFSGNLLDLSQLKELREFSVSNNKLEGTLGSWFEHMENLAHVELDNNSFTGSLPHPPKTLTRFTADNNKFSGEIPDSWDDDESMLQYFSCVGCDLKCPEKKPDMFAHLRYSTHCRDAKKARKWEPTNKNGDAVPSFKTPVFKGFY